MGLAQIPFADSLDLNLLASVLTNGMQLTENQPQLVDIIVGILLTVKMNHSK